MIIPRYKSKVGLFKTNRVERYVEKLPESGNYTININDTFIPIFPGIGATSFQGNTDYWQLRVTTDTKTLSVPIISPYDVSPNDYMSFVFGTSSQKASTQNLIGSLWGMTGGNGIYSVDTPAWNDIHYLDNFNNPIEAPSSLYYYFFWKYDVISPTYMYINVGESLPASGNKFSKGDVGFVENGISVKTVSLGTGAHRFKFLWNKSTRLASIYEDVNFVDTGLFTTLIATYSMSASYTGGAPFYIQGVALGPSSSTYTLNVNTPFLTTVITNNHTGPATESNYGRTSSTPPITSLFGPTAIY